MDEREISIELAEKIIRHNPQLHDGLQRALREFGLLPSVYVESVLENTPDLTEEEKRVLKSIKSNIRTYGPGYRTSKRLQPLIDKIKSLPPTEPSNEDDRES